MPVFNMMQGGGDGSGSNNYGTLPPQVTNFYAVSSSESVSLFWTNPIDDNFSGTLIVRKSGNYPVSQTDGIQIYSGVNATYIDTGLTNDTKYYYRAFAYNSNIEYQTIYCVVEAIPKTAQQLSSLPIGAKLKFGTLFNQKIIQTIANKTDNLVTLITDKIVFCGSFDAKEPQNTDSNIQEYGNNRYSLSNIHQWLNSNAPEGQWYTSQHTFDAPPSTLNVDSLPYDTLSGYLHQWDSFELQKLQTVNVDVCKPNADGGGTETISTKIYLPSVTEVNLIVSGLVEGMPLAMFTDDTSRAAKYTSTCASIRYGNVTQTGPYWLRSPTQTLSYVGRQIGNTGTLSGGAVYFGTPGVRPLCNLLPSTTVSLQPDSDGCYTLM